MLYPAYFAAEDTIRHFHGAYCDRRYLQDTSLYLATEAWLWRNLEVDPLGPDDLPCRADGRIFNPG